MAAAIQIQGLTKKFLQRGEVVAVDNLNLEVQEGEIFDRPPQTVQRYLVEKMASAHVIWRFNNKVRYMPPGRALRIETLAPAVVHWSVDSWLTVRDTSTRDTTLGVHVADLQTLDLQIGDRIDLTFYWPEADRWEGTNFGVVCLD